LDGVSLFNCPAFKNLCAKATAMDERTLNPFLFEMLFKIRTWVTEFDASATEAPNLEILMDESVQCDAARRNISTVAPGIQLNVVVSFDRH
jgi:hypothetical protein